MMFGGDGIEGPGQLGRLLRNLVFTGMLVSAMVVPAAAQLFSDRPPPVPPGSVPDPGNAISLAPPSGLASIPPAPLTQPSIIAVPPARSEEHTSELQSRRDLVCRLLLEK